MLSRLCLPKSDPIERWTLNNSYVLLQFILNTPTPYNQILLDVVALSKIDKHLQKMSTFYLKMAFLKKCLLQHRNWLFPIEDILDNSGIDKLSYFFQV
jgi:hypothetical protein